VLVWRAPAQRLPKEANPASPTGAEESGYSKRKPEMPWKLDVSHFNVVYGLCHIVVQ